MIEICNLRKQKPTQLYDIKVDRSSILGNPFPMRNELERNSVCDKYELHFNCRVNEYGDTFFKREIKRIITIYQTYGKLRLFCWCSPKRCHAETIKKYIENINI
jgi:hypothetical protein